MRSVRFAQVLSSLLVLLVAQATVNADIDVETLASGVAGLKSNELRRPSGSRRVNALSLHFLELAWAGSPLDQGDPVPLGNVVLIDDRGYALTLAYSLARAATPLAYRPGGEPVAMEVKATEAGSAAALVRLKGTEAGRSVPMVPGLVRPRLGDKVLVVGRGFRDEPRALVRHVSSVYGQYFVRNSVLIEGMVVLDGPVPPGWDGAAVLDEGGRLIGLALGWSEAGSAVGYVVATDTLDRGVAQSLARAREGGWLGIEGKPAAAGGVAGLRVTQVASGSPADLAGLAPGDVIVACEGRAVAGRTTIGIEALEAGVGRTLHLETVREGSRRTVAVALAAYPEPNAQELSQQLLGISVQVLDRDLALGLGVAGVRGMAVVEVQQGSPAARVGLQPGDIIVRLGDVQTATIEDYAATLASLAPGSAVNLLIRRGQEQGVVQLRLRDRQ